jgi:DNA-binding CsgD family transcriptional regulator
MIRRNHDLTSLLAAAIGLAQAPRSDEFDTLHIGDARFRLIAQHHEATGWVVVLMQDNGEDELSDDRLKSWYGLTSREIQVARLLAERQSNREIAEQLNITGYTAGRHTEKVLRKLGVGSRRDVRSKLIGCFSQFHGRAPDHIFTNHGSAGAAVLPFTDPRFDAELLREPARAG